MSDVSIYPLRLPRSLRAGVERMSAQDGVSINQFVAIAVAEKLATMQAEAFFAERRARADLDAFDRILNREGGESPGPKDQP
ncbi:MAG: toxin-antitoxin system HicB family antitoxin [Casimicrobiaceae bacterium]|nr:toxin-antitoxin system HicB family antitoxin [Casimicrobiaceae bacterium]